MAYQSGALDHNNNSTDHPEIEYGVADGNDYPAHEHMYAAFISMVKVGVIVIAVILLGMAYFLT
jgi:hypothetical protein